MPRSAIGMATYDKEYVFNIDQFLIDTYPRMGLPARRALCARVREEIDEETIEELVNGIVADYALDLQNWLPEDYYDEDEDEDDD